MIIRLIILMMMIGRPLGMAIGETLMRHLPLGLQYMRCTLCIYFYFIIIIYIFFKSYYYTTTVRLFIP